ncbi:uncharacterized protein LOC108030991 [Drosophila biarmipes]|uniref:uncharacterized protein LOC108030991 n=1 Tax=Drosophila biarmipes TaxID=125945 RepID=UPI0007E734CC|nr:uncharacterized protein LOC108030991 [Drosophila biarmipes]
MKVAGFGWVLAPILLRLASEVVADSSSYFTEYNTSPMKAVVAIKHIHVFGESNYMKVKAYIHDDRTHFDLYVQMLHELGSNHLIINIKVRVKPDGSSVFVPLFELRRINFCEFLSEYRSNPVMRFMFKKNIKLNEIIVCPVRVGNYSMLNSNVANGIQTQGIQNGTYKFFAEIVEEIGEIAKVFALQVTSMLYIVEKDRECQALRSGIECV